MRQERLPQAGHPQGIRPPTESLPMPSWLVPCSTAGATKPCDTQGERGAERGGDTPRVIQILRGSSIRGQSVASWQSIVKIVFTTPCWRHVCLGTLENYEIGHSMILNSGTSVIQDEKLVTKVLICKLVSLIIKMIVLQILSLFNCLHLLVKIFPKGTGPFCVLAV